MADEPKRIYPELVTEQIPGDPTLSELQAHARALGTYLHLVLTGPLGVEYDSETPTQKPKVKP